VGQRLHTVERGIAPPESDKVGVASLLDDAPAIKHQNTICMAQGVQSVRNQDRDATLRACLERIEDAFLSAGVDCGRRVVEDQDVGLQDQAARYRQTLPLPARER
jgi:hypothetical protein